MLNRLCLCGRLSKDPELRTTSNGTAVATFTIAVDRNFTSGGKKETDFVPVVVWRNLAETCNTYLAKGKMVNVDGKLQIRAYEDAKGNRRTIAECVAQEVQFLTPKGEYVQAKDECGPEEMAPLDEIPF